MTRPDRDTRNVGSPLSESDIAMFQQYGVSGDFLLRAGVRRVDHKQAQDQCGVRYKSQHLEGIAFPYVDPLENRVLTYRIRRDNPEVDSDGEQIAKYVNPQDRRHLYFAPDCAKQLSDSSSTVIIVEAEKSVLAICDAELRASRDRALVFATGGCWGWRGVVGKTTGPTGARVDEKGALTDFNKVVWQGRDVVVAFDANAATNPKVQNARRALVNELESRGGVVRIVEIPVAAGVNGPDDYIGRCGDDAWWALVDAARPTRRPAEAASVLRRSQATQLVDLAVESGVTFWHTTLGEPYASLRIDGHTENHPLRGMVRDYLARAYYKRYGKSAASAALKDALGTLAGMAKYDGETHPVAVRIAHQGDTLYLDLGDPTWQAIFIAAPGWRVISNPPVRFWRPAGMRALPVPTVGGTVDQLRQLWRMDEDTWTLLVSWVMACFSRGPYPVLIETGEQGSGKSTLGRMVRSLVDPRLPDLRGVPRDERDLMIGALSSYVVALDNLSGLPSWLSDALCRIATGGGLATRALYADLDETLLEVKRPILLTGIEQPATHSDLLDRALTVTLPTIDDHLRGDEATLWERYEQMRPSILGALCDAVSTALRRGKEVSLHRRPRMADACRWVTAAAPALGWPDERVVDTWLGSRAVASADLVSHDAVAQALLAMSGDAIWQGTSGELLALLSSRVSESTRRARTWPGSPRGLAGALRRLAPDLRRAGISVELPVLGRTARERIVTIRRLFAEQDKQDRPDSAADSQRFCSPIEVEASPEGVRWPTVENPQESPLSSDLSDLSGLGHPDQIEGRDGRF